MTAPYLVPVLIRLRSDFDALNPQRDRGADGWIGDAAHKVEVSDHNPRPNGAVLAVDIDATGPWPEPFNDYVQWIVDRERAGITANLEYVIWNHHIAGRSSDWQWESYTATNDPHTGHAHFSARHDHVNENNTRSNHLEDVDMLSASEITDAVWGAGLGRGDNRETTAEMLSRIESVENKVDALATDIKTILNRIPTA